MKKRIVLSLLITAVIGLAIGCASTNPNAGKPIVNDQGVVTGTQPAYIPNTIVTQGASLVQQAAPVIPAPYGDAAAIAASLALAIAAYVAKLKNQQAAASSTLAAQTLAAGVVKAGASTPDVLRIVSDVAANTSTSAAAVVAAHIADATN